MSLYFEYIATILATYLIRAVMFSMERMLFLDPHTLLVATRTATAPTLVWRNRKFSH